MTVQERRSAGLLLLRIYRSQTGLRACLQMIISNKTNSLKVHFM